MVTKYQDLGYNRILVALDGTDQQDEVLHRAIVVAANNNSELYIGHVICLLYTSPSPRDS